MSSKNVLVTGGAGFIGSALVDALLEQGEHVIVFDDFSGGRPENLEAAHQIDKKRLKVLKGDVRDFESFSIAAKNVDEIFHMAVLNLRLSLKDPAVVHDVNVNGTVNACMVAKQNKRIKKLVYVSSSEVYGTAEYVPMDENHPLNPRTPYSASKAAGEMYVQAFHRTFGIPTMMVRPFNTYGPRAREDAYVEVLPRFVGRATRGLPPIIHGDGNQTRDFTFISDTVEGIVLAASCEDLLGDVVNIAYGKEVSINELARVVLVVLNKEKDLVPVHRSPRRGDVRRHFASIAKARRLFGYKPKVPIRNGVNRYVKWYLNRQRSGVPIGSNRSIASRKRGKRKRGCGDRADGCTVRT